jgi:hypothetical protein
MITATEISVVLPNGDPEWVEKFLNAWGALAEAVDEFYDLAEQTPLGFMGLVNSGLKVTEKALADIEKAVIKHNKVI